MINRHFEEIKLLQQKLDGYRDASVEEFKQKAKVHVIVDCFDFVLVLFSLNVWLTVCLHKRVRVSRTLPEQKQQLQCLSASIQVIFTQSINCR